jgi:hypothetical protein
MEGEHGHRPVLDRIGHLRPARISNSQVEVIICDIETKKLRFLERD